jgi:hypothetical protein
MYNELGAHCMYACTGNWISLSDLFRPRYQRLISHSDLVACLADTQPKNKRPTQDEEEEVSPALCKLNNEHSAKLISRAGKKGRVNKQIKFNAPRGAFSARPTEFAELSALGRKLGRFNLAK